MSKWIGKVVKFGDRIFFFFVEEISLLAYVGIFAFIVVVLGGAYAILTPFGHGIGQNDNPLQCVTLMQGLYFSIVTVSSLGYGDLHPIGLSKAVACMEVLFGLSVIGIMIAKATSRRISHHVQHLFSSDAQKRLDDMSILISKIKQDIIRIMPLVPAAYPNTPSDAKSEGRDELLREFQNIVSLLNSQCSALVDYCAYETAQGGYFSIIPNGAVNRTGEVIDTTLMQLVQMIISLPPEAKTDVLTRQNRQQISEALESVKKLCRMVQIQVKETPTLNVFNRIKETCENVPSSYFATPEESQPDQRLMNSNTPLEPHNE